VLLVKTAAQEMITWLQNADPLIVPDALDFMVTRGVVKKFAELFRGSTEELEVPVSPIIDSIYLMEV
jgi:Ni,Fe-hydrogenase maturation factor